MRRTAVAEEDRSAGVDAAPWRVVSVTAMPGYRLQVRFADGIEGMVDMSGLIGGPRPGVFSVLADPERFSRVRLNNGVTVWPDAMPAWPHDLDLAPDAMHDEIAEHGEWVVN